MATSRRAALERHTSRSVSARLNRTLTNGRIPMSDDSGGRTASGIPATIRPSTGVSKDLQNREGEENLMRLRFLLVAVAAAAIAGIAVPAAGALTFPDDVCPIRSGTVIKVCPSGETGKSYSYQIKGRDGTGCVPYVKFRADGLPPGLSIDSGSGLISGIPTQTGTYVFWVSMTDIKASEGGVFWCADNDSTEKQFEITILQGLQIQQRQSALTPGQLTVPYSLQFTAAGGSPSWT